MLVKVNKTSLEHRIQKQELEDSGRRFDKNISMTIYFFKATEIGGSSYVKIPLRPSAILNFESYGVNYCFFRLILANLDPCINSHPNRVSKYRQYFDELKIQSFDFSHGFRFSDVHIF